MVVLKDVSAELQQHGLLDPSLPFLSTDPAYISVLLFQPCGVIEATAGGVHARDRDQMTAQMTGFLSTAKTVSADLVSCPEYSCTWEALVGSIENDVMPAPGKLWAIGCESISRESLRHRVEAVEPYCTVICDEQSIQGNGDFLDLLCYLFVATKAATGEAVRVLLLQPKTHPMGGDTFEYEHLIQGRTLYRFGSEGSNRLVGLICSDSLAPNFGNDIAPQLTQNTLILHIQLNANPTSPAFRAYRELCCLEAPRTTEILCLNWAKGTLLSENGRDIPWIEEPRTILFRPLGELKTDDETVLANHRKGCFFTYWQTHESAAFIFAPDAQVFFLKTTKPVVRGPATNARRTGPLMAERYEWVDAAWSPFPDDCHGGFDSYWLDTQPTLRPHLDRYLAEPVNAERLIQLSTGRGLATDWNHWKQLPSFRLESDDTSCRLTLCWSARGKGFEFRDQCRRDFLGFASVVADASQFSARLTAFKEAPFSVEYKADHLYNRHRNLHSAGGRSATAVFLGFEPDTARLTQVKKSLVAELKNVGQDDQLLAVWYRDSHGVLRDYMDLDVPTFTEDPNLSPVGINNPGA